ncbi:tetratricopeptide (TPR) repeat protein [Pontibacter aydingkolensis]|uniref:phospholipase D n=1 Tax=Pontibacter aydingkolensis TaxID=1911536 RepID=A0ABS7CV36_9BACT|nr:phospholipase D-like domain-containing protein [Pontibacter aydingkolensis]MBW7467721.1 hypothetical protein [Pontibacter aydingkolensis]
MISAHFKNIKNELIKEISLAKYSIKIAVAWFTNAEIFDALLLKCKAEKIKVELIIIGDSINIRPYGIDFNLLIENGGNVFLSESDTLMHHKFCVIDDRVLINGSYNWTYLAESSNNENITIIKDNAHLINCFNSEFGRLIVNKQPENSINQFSRSQATDFGRIMNYDDIKVEEYVASANYLHKKGDVADVLNILKIVNAKDTKTANSFLSAKINEGDELYLELYKSITSNSEEILNKKSYSDYCEVIKRLINKENYIDAIKEANECIKKYPYRFSVHVYCGDAKMQLNDIEGAKLEYKKALKSKATPGANLVYYGKTYNYRFFPYADIYLKLGDKDGVISQLKSAVNTYRYKNITKGVERAQDYLRRIENNESITRIF